MRVLFYGARGKRYAKTQVSSALPIIKKYMNFWAMIRGNYA